jgi:TP901 family phage tail tape measure protein
MAEKTAEVRLKAHTAGFIADLRKAGQAMHVTGKDARDLAGDLDYIGNRSLAMGGGLLLALGGLANVYRKYDAALSDFRAVTGASADQVNALGEASQNVGRQFGISANEVVEAGTALAKAGVSVTDVLTGGLQGAVALSATGSLELADAAEIAAIAMHQFGMSGKDIPLVADMLSKGANDAVGDVRDLAWALRQSGLVAGQFNLDMDDTVGTLSLFAQQGLIGSDAGTSFKSMLLAIAGPSGVASKKMDELGISFYDANGEFIGLAESADMLQAQLGDLTEQQRNQALATIFGQDAIRSANIMINEGGDAIRAWADNVNDAGYASELAQGKLDNLNGDLSKLKVSAENAVLNGGSGFNQSLREGVQLLTGFTDGLSNMDPALAGNIIRTAAVAGGLLLLVGGLSKTAAAVINGIEHWKTFNSWLGNVQSSAGKTGTVIAGLGRSLGLLAVAWTAASLASDLFVHKAPQVNSRGDFAKMLGDSAEGPGGTSMTRDQLDTMFNRQWVESGRKSQYMKADSGPDITTLDALKRVLSPNMVNNVDDFMTTAVGQNEHSTINMFKDTFGQADQAIAGMVQAGHMDAATQSFKEFMSVAEEGGYSVQQLATLFPQYRDAIEQTAIAQEGAAPPTQRLNELMLGNVPIVEKQASAAETAAAKQEMLGAAFEETGVLVGGVVGDMEKFLDLLFATGMATMSARDANAAYHEALRGVGETVKELIEKHGGVSAALNKTKTDFDTTTEAGALANDAFQGVARGGMAEVEAMAAQGLGQDELQHKLEQTYWDLIESGEAFGLSRDAARRLTREILGVPDGVTIDSWMSSEAKRVAEETNAELDRLDGRVVTVVTRAVTEQITKYRQEGTPSGHEKAAVLEGKAYGQGRKADGGRIVGPGGPREDNLLHWLSNGEYVLDAEDVKAMGGFNAIDTMRRQLHTRGAAAFNATAMSRSRHAVPQLDYDKLAAVTKSGPAVQFSPTINTQDPRAAAMVAMGELGHLVEAKGL